MTAASWDGMVAADRAQLRRDHGMTQAVAETQAWVDARNHYANVSFRQGHRVSWWQAVEAVLTAQAQWTHLSEAARAAERAKGAGSIYSPLFNQAETEQN